MKDIRIFDNDMDRINAICEKYDVSDWEVVNLLLDSIEDEDDADRMFKWKEA